MKIRVALWAGAALSLTMLLASCSFEDLPWIGSSKPSSSCQASATPPDEACENNEDTEGIRQTFTVVAKEYRTSGYHFMSEDGIDYVLAPDLQIDPRDADPNRVVYDSVKEGQILTVYAVKHLFSSDRRVITSIESIKNP